MPARRASGAGARDRHYPHVFVNQALHYRFRLGAPTQLVQWASPGGALHGMHNVGLYAQDQWTLRRVTFNLGVRFDHVKGWVPEQTRPGGVFVPPLSIARIENLPNFNDISPRVGAAYDLFGNGRTALKVSLGRFVGAVGTNVAEAVNPANAVVTSSTRTWTDTNGNFRPDCVLQSIEANGECGALDNRAARHGTGGSSRSPSRCSGRGCSNSAGSSTSDPNGTRSAAAVSFQRNTLRADS